MLRSLQMRWIDLLFLHWPLAADVLRPLVPATLELDSFDGRPWVGVVPFRMSDVRPQLGPAIPTATDFPELNVRTYVRHGDQAGIWFFSLDAESWLAVMGARAATNLPYFYARMKSERVGPDVFYESERSHPGAANAEFRARYRPVGDVFASAAGSFEHWATERYCLFSAARDGDLLRVDVEHRPWPLQPAVAIVDQNTMAQASGIALPDDAPHALFAQELDVVAHWPVEVAEGGR